MFLCIILAFSAFAADIAFKPGTYTAAAAGRNGPVEVEVTVDKNKIKSVKVLNHKETKSISTAPIEQLPKAIVADQSLAVDAVSGASLTSKAILEATETALKQATSDISPLLIAKSKPKQKAKDATADIVVIGGGNAGMIASIVGAKSGYKVILLEKMGMLGGGDSMLISTGLAAGGSKLSLKLDKNATAEKFYEYLLYQASLKNVPVDKESVKAYALRTGEMIDYLTEIGVDLSKFSGTDFDNDEAFYHMMGDGSAPGISIVPALAKQVQKYKVDYRLNNRAMNLIMDKGKITGVEVSSPEGNYKIKAKAVVISSGGFASNEQLVIENYGTEWVGRPTTGAKSATGDGIVMAQKIGAGTYHMDQVKANYLCYVLPTGDGISLNALTPYIALVNHDGKRFVSEAYPSIPYKARAVMKQPQHEAYAIFGEQAIKNSKLISGYNDAGYFITADSIEELANKLDVNKKNFIETMTKYVEDGKKGEDRDFGRKIFHPLGEGKFYAAKVTPSMQSTYGGIKVNTKGQVLDKSDKVIPGLYAAGAVSGHASFGNEVGGQAIIAITYGQIAGESAVNQLKGK